MIHVRFKAPKQITHKMNEYGCCGFVSYGYRVDDNNEIQHIKNPDYKWPAKLARIGDTFVFSDELDIKERCKK